MGLHSLLQAPPALADVTRTFFSTLAAAADPLPTPHSPPEVVSID